MRILRASLLVATVVAPLSVSAEESEDEIVPMEESEAAIEARKIIQNRKYQLEHEALIAVGVLPGDPYYKGYAATVSYTWHFSDLFAWEVASFTYSLNVDSKLKSKILEQIAATGSNQPAFPEVQMIIGSNFIFKPLYGKQAIFNTSVVHLEAYLQTGPRFLRVQEVIANNSPPSDRFTFGLDFGFGLRLWLTEVMSARVDLGELIYFLPQARSSGTQVKQAFHVQLGIAFNLRSDE